jgi:hypothetical protein
MRRFRLRRVRTYTGYSIGCVIAWLIVLAAARVFASKERQHDIILGCCGWWMGWTSATIARAGYPPPKPNPLHRLAG